MGYGWVRGKSDDNKVLRQVQVGSYLKSILSLTLVDVKLVFSLNKVDTPKSDFPNLDLTLGDSGFRWRLDLIGS